MECCLGYGMCCIGSLVEQHSGEERDDSVVLGYFEGV